MKKYEKQSLIKFTFIYFFSIALLILIVGFLYFWQQKHFIMKKTVMQMYQYSTMLSQTNFQYKEDGFSYDLEQKIKVEFEIPVKIDNFYIKAFPLQNYNKVATIKIDAKPIDKEIFELKVFTLIIQAVLLLIFVLISYLLAKISLKPMQDTISHLDRFLSDLIHDLNTPATAILLNINMILKNEKDEKKQKQLKRIETSASLIASLHENLELILEQKQDFEDIKLYNLLEEKIEDFKLLYPHIIFELDCPTNEIINTNKKSFLRIVDNILSNSSKYSSANSKIKIIYKNKKLTIQDNGKGIKYPKKIFERRYKETEQGYGIGMHIVHRLCDNLNIEISIESKENIGTKIELSNKLF